MVVQPAAVILFKILMDVQPAVLTAAVFLSGRATPARLRALTVVLMSGAHWSL